MNNTKLADTIKTLTLRQPSVRTFIVNSVSPFVQYAAREKVKIVHNSEPRSTLSNVYVI